ncbi:Chondroitin sulfate synthase 2 [Blattella germanica]|nr:Chondroitin sulfate synthase 2 [Blattella germanica]
MLSFFGTLCRQNKYFIFGLCLGIFAGLILTPILENECLFNEGLQRQKNDHLHSRSLSSDLDTSGDEYEPRINVAGKPKKAQKTPNLLNRPRYYSTELGIREKLFIGILSSQHDVSGRGVAMNKTIAHLVDKVMFFIDAPGPRKLNISLPGGIVGFTDSRKILKPFHMLKYITDNFLDEFDFYFLVKDTTYIKARHLYEMVQGISVSEDVHAGNGKKDEHTSFCSLDAGLLLSNSVIRKVKSALDWCVKNAFSDSDDDNLGRCILHATSISCQESIQGHTFSSYVLDDGFSIEDDMQKITKDQKFDSALTVYPIQDQTVIFLFHAYFCKVALAHNKQDIATLRNSLMNMSALTPGGKDSVSWPVGNPPGNIPGSRFDVLKWDYFTETEIYLDSDFSTVKKLEGADKNDVQYVLNATIKRMEAEYGGHLQYRRLVNGYRRFDPSRGMDYRLDLAFRDTTTGKEVHKRLEVCKPLGRVEVVPMPYVTENVRVNLVLPVEAEYRSEAITFMEKYAKICMEKRDKTFLMLVLLYDPSLPGKGTKDDIFLSVKEMALSLSERYKKDGSKIAWVSIKVPTSNGLVNEPLLEFAMADLVVRKFSPESLILICKSNMDVRQDYLNRVRMNTISGWQIFSPVPFSEYHPDIVYSASNTQPKELDIDKSYGHYDTREFGHIAFHARDYTTARKRVENMIPVIRSDRDIHSLMGINYNGHTMPPISLYGMFVQSANLHVLRAIEPGLRLRHRERNCEDTDTQCIEARAFNLGSKSQLAQLILEYMSSQMITSS